MIETIIICVVLAGCVGLLWRPYISEWYADWQLNRALKKWYVDEISNKKLIDHLGRSK